MEIRQFIDDVVSQTNRVPGHLASDPDEPLVISANIVITLDPHLLADFEAEMDRLSHSRDHDVDYPAERGHSGARISRRNGGLLHWVLVIPPLVGRIGKGLLGGLFLLVVVYAIVSATVETAWGIEPPASTVVAIVIVVVILGWYALREFAAAREQSPPRDGS
jgi:hypothetical protein